MEPGLDDHSSARSNRLLGKLFTSAGVLLAEVFGDSKLELKIQDQTFTFEVFSDGDVSPTSSLRVTRWTVSDNRDAVVKHATAKVQHMLDARKDDLEFTVSRIAALTTRSKPRRAM